MKKIYKTDTGTKIFFGLFNTFITVVASYILFFYTGPRSAYKIAATIFCLILSNLWFLDLLFFNVIIEDDKITAKIRFFSFLHRYRSISWHNIQSLQAKGGFFLEEMGWIEIIPKDIKRWQIPKIISIPIIFGVTPYVLQDILPRLPQDAVVKIEPFLKKYIEGKPKVYTRRKLIIIAILLLLMVIGGFLLSWYLAFYNPWIR